MRGGFVAAAGEIQISDLAGAEYTESVHAFRGQIDSAGLRRGGGKKQLLLLDEYRVGIAQLIIKFCHGVARLRCGL